MALVDSGATNNVRHGTSREAETAVAVQVTLADGKGELLQLPTGTLLCGSESQVIVSMGLLRGILGCTIWWEDDEQMQITHPRRGVILAVEQDNTPQISEALALELIAEMEAVVTSAPWHQPESCV